MLQRLVPLDSPLQVDKTCVTYLKGSKVDLKLQPKKGVGKWNSVKNGSYSQAVRMIFMHLKDGGETALL